MEDPLGAEFARKKRVIAYIDGFNFYFGLRDSGMHAHMWVDPVALVESLLRQAQRLERVKYFTSRISGGRASDPPHDRARREAKRVRQATYLDALATRQRLELHYGHFLEKPERCLSCKAQWMRSEEKKTDVLIASHMLSDVFSNECDDLMLISGDSDLVPPISMIRSRFPDRRVVVAFPPNRHAEDLRRCANAHFTISASKIRKAQLPDEVVTATGHRLWRPQEWR